MADELDPVRRNAVADSIGQLRATAASLRHGADTIDDCNASWAGSLDPDDPEPGRHQAALDAAVAIAQVADQSRAVARLLADLADSTAANFGIGG